MRPAMRWMRIYSSRSASLAAGSPAPRALHFTTPAPKPTSSPCNRPPEQVHFIFTPRLRPQQPEDSAGRLPGPFPARQDAAAQQQAGSRCPRAWRSPTGRPRWHFPDLWGQAARSSHGPANVRREETAASFPPDPGKGRMVTEGKAAPAEGMRLPGKMTKSGCVRGEKMKKICGF